MHPHQYAAHASPGEEWEAGQEENDGEKREEKVFIATVRGLFV